MVSDDKFSAAFFCLSSHCEATKLTKFSSLNQQKMILFFFFFQVLRVSFVSDCQTDIDLPSSCVIAGVDRKAGVEAHSQRVEAGWTVYDCSFGGKPQLSCVKFRVVPRPRDGAFQYAFVQAAAKKAAMLQPEPGQALVFTALTSVTIELLTLTFCFRPFPYSFTMFDMCSFLA